MTIKDVQISPIRESIYAMSLAVVNAGENGKCSSSSPAPATHRAPLIKVQKAQIPCQVGMEWVCRKRRFDDQRKETGDFPFKQQTPSPHHAVAERTPRVCIVRIQFSVQHACSPFPALYIFLSIPA
jgi:hypothetical protein